MPFVQKFCQGRVKGTLPFAIHRSVSINQAGIYDKDMVTDKQKKNLIRNEELTPKERRERARKAGIASAKARAARKPFKEMAKAVNQEDRQKIMNTLVLEAEGGSLPHMELFLKLLGEHPSQDTQLADKTISISIGGEPDEYAD